MGATCQAKYVLDGDGLTLEIRYKFGLFSYPVIDPKVPYEIDLSVTVAEYMPTYIPTLMLFADSLIDMRPIFRFM